MDDFEFLNDVNFPLTFSNLFQNEPVHLHASNAENSDIAEIADIQQHSKAPGSDDFPGDIFADMAMAQPMIDNGSGPSNLGWFYPSPPKEAVYLQPPKLKGCREIFIREMKNLYPLQNVLVCPIPFVFNDFNPTRCCGLCFKRTSCLQLIIDSFKLLAEGCEKENIPFDSLFAIGLDVVISINASLSESVDSDPLDSDAFIHMEVGLSCLNRSIYALFKFRKVAFPLIDDDPQKLEYTAQVEECAHRMRMAIDGNPFLKDKFVNDAVDDAMLCLLPGFAELRTTQVEEYCISNPSPTHGADSNFIILTPEELLQIKQYLVEKTKFAKW
ncbi:hypothetical protein DM01DRAFT_1349916 [Hesseltinella vesiculosa]|uniref:Uncharacterized protein n=1 Tax=Hesseltinella vesiculosa TaxID=101127 RepID=A0A1X2G3M6_9FUNG|nr:hypothetical protein DM01DRAFT_1349916 [Hesseltinella vesiculosa]